MRELEPLPRGHEAPERINTSARERMRETLKGALTEFGSPLEGVDQLDAHFVIGPDEVDFDGPNTLSAGENLKSVEIIGSAYPTEKPQNYQLRVLRTYEQGAAADSDERSDDRLVLDDYFVIAKNLRSDLYSQWRYFLTGKDEDSPISKPASEEISVQNRQMLSRQQREAMGILALNEYFNGETEEPYIARCDFERVVLPILKLLDADHAVDHKPSDANDN